MVIGSPRVKLCDHHPLQNFAGCTDLSFHGRPRWVKPNERPGNSMPPKPGSQSWMSTFIFLYNPNFVWFLIAVITWFLFPWHLDTITNPFTFKYILYRLCALTVPTALYYWYWYSSLYIFRFSRRKFLPSSQPPFSRMVHDVWYFLLGTAQATLWELAFILLLKSGRLPYDTTADVLSSPILRTISSIVLYPTTALSHPPNPSTLSIHENLPLLRLCLGTALVPLWRDIHFYFAHRLLHHRPLYRFVHSLHHRNTDTEPFAGLCMHPVEHFYYYSCVALSLYLRLHPFVFYWNLIHLLLSPAASHSGWEDQFQSDVYHYLHHRYFECNYGTSGTRLDMACGTYRETMAAPGSYRGAASHVPPVVPTRSGWRFWPKSLPDAWYWVFTVLWGALCLAVCTGYVQRAPHPPPPCPVWCAGWGRALGRCPCRSPSHTGPQTLHVPLPQGPISGEVGARVLLLVVGAGPFRGPPVRVSWRKADWDAYVGWANSFS